MSRPKIVTEPYTTDGLLNLKNKKIHQIGNTSVDLLRVVVGSEERVCLCRGLRVGRPGTRSSHLGCLPPAGLPSSQATLSSAVPRCRADGTSPPRHTPFSSLGRQREAFLAEEKLSSFLLKLFNLLFYDEVPPKSGFKRNLHSYPVTPLEPDDKRVYVFCLSVMALNIVPLEEMPSWGPGIF